MMEPSLYPLQKAHESRLYLIALVLLIARLRTLSTTNRFLTGLFNLLGTFFHELAHYMVGLLLGAKPSGFSLWPKPHREGGVVLGSVTFANLRFYNTLPTALAPLLLFILAYLANIRLFSPQDESLFSYTLSLFIIVILLENAIPSTTDIKVAFRDKLGLTLYVGGGLVYLFRNQIEAKLPLWVPFFQ
ncbi:MAG: hypothetical protein HQL72_09355 [Magnetococcales bacterium]|nr:hypothetical protein [Magnetococcales bacterium]